MLSPDAFPEVNLAKKNCVGGRPPLGELTALPGPLTELRKGKRGKG